MAGFSRPSPSLLSLPGELLAAVASLLDDPADRARLELTCRAAAAAGNARGLSMGPHLDAIGIHTTLTRLELRKCGLVSLPAAFSGLSALCHLDLSSNEDLKHGWEHLACLAALTRLDMSFSGPPAAVPRQCRLLGSASFTRLRSLSLGILTDDHASEEGERLNPAPLPRDFLPRFPQLSSLELTEWERGALPSPLSSLTALRSLSLDVCGLAEGTLDHLPRQLTSLTLSACGLRHMPGQLSRLTSLRSLNMRLNDIASWGPLASLGSLTNFSFGSLGITSTPTELCALSALQELDMSSAWNLSSGISQLSCCGRLTRLQADYCNSKPIEEVGTLSSLRVLSLKGSCWGSGYTNNAAGLLAISGLHHLEELNLAQACLAQVPPAIAALSRLTCLDMSWTRGLVSGWQHLAGLGSRLVSLDLSSSALATIPPEMSCLIALQRLRLDEMPALSRSTAPGWQHLLPLTRLVHLSLLQCDLVRLPPELAPLHERMRIRF
ncbi:hypothetical protein ABPG75_012928 [Micractinium tetrahymenae]